MQNFSLDDLYDATVIDADGDKVAGVSQVYLDDQTGEPNWVTVQTGFFGSNESFVPLEGALFTERELRVPFSKQAIKDAPNFDADHHLSREDEARLYQHYNLTQPGYGDRDRRDLTDGRVDDRRDSRVDAAGVGAAGVGAAGLAGAAGRDRDRDGIDDRRDWDRTDRDVKDRDRTLTDRDLTDRDRDGDRLERDRNDRDGGFLDRDFTDKDRDGDRLERDRDVDVRHDDQFTGTVHVSDRDGGDRLIEDRRPAGRDEVQSDFDRHDDDLERRRRELDERERELELDRREMELEQREREVSRLRRAERRGDRRN